MLTSFMLGQSVTNLQLIGVAIVIAGLVLPRLVTFNKSVEVRS